MPRILREVLWLSLLLTASGAHAADYLIGTQTKVSDADAATVDGELADFDSGNAAIAVDVESRRALIVWSGEDGDMEVTDPDPDDDTPAPTMVDGEFEVFGKLVTTEQLATLTVPLRVSQMGDDLETDAAERARFAGRNPAVAWNETSEEYLVVWEGDDNTGALVDDEFEIYGQRIDRLGVFQGEPFRISTMGDDTATNATERARYNAFRPSVSVDPDSGNYLVAWEGDTDSGSLVDDEFEIFGRVIASNGAPAGEQFRISTMGDDAATDPAVRADYDAYKPAVAFNRVSGTFIVAWQGDDNQSGLANGEFEVYVQQVDITGALVGSAIRVSNMGPDGDSAYDALSPAVAIVPDSGVAMIAWHGDTSTSVLVDNEFEIHGRFMDAAGTLLGPSVRISTMGSDSETDPAERVRYKAENVAVSWNSKSEHFLVAWHGDYATGKFVDDEFEIHGRFVDVNGAAVSKRFLISQMGTHGDTDTAADRQKFAGYDPALAYVQDYFVSTWHGDAALNGYEEVFMQRVAMDYTKLELTGTGPETSIMAPEPVVYSFTMENTGNKTAENVHLVVRNTEGFPFTLSGCGETSDPELCVLGDIAPGESVEFELTIQTDHLELGDTQSTLVTLVTYTDTALDAPAGASSSFYTLVSLTVEGGSGSSDWLWLLMLAGVPLLLGRKRNA